VTDTPTTTDAAPVDAVPADAAADVSAGAGVSTGVGARSGPHPGRRSRSSRASRVRLAVVGIVLAGAFVALLVKGLGGSLDYFETVDQAVAHKTMLGGQTFRLEGLVVAGTVHRSGSTVQFVAAGTIHRIAVVNYGSPPQLFQPDVPVVVVGHFSGAVFISNQIIVDHSAQYIEEFPSRVRAPNGTTR
jgi:cytochrome c-type biogenesis protein CcmE